MLKRRRQIAVIGGGKCSARVGELAEQVGVELGQRGVTLICGGLGGVMEAAARGARRAGGLTVGVLPTYDRRTANPWLDVIIPTGFGHGRNVIVVGHEPSLHRLVRRLTGSDHAIAPLKKGGIAKIGFSDADLRRKGALAWTLTPKQLLS